MKNCFLRIGFEYGAKAADSVAELHRKLPVEHPKLPIDIEKLPIQAPSDFQQVLPERDGDGFGTVGGAEFPEEN
ncbi:MAG: hypothetical protein KBT68_06580 [bacterium]|nr:hypothetical protein [Candidatus Colisoma equi]